MTENDPAHPEVSDPELTPAQEDAVRRRLAAARHTGPIPTEVAARLDRVLSGLADEQTPAPLGDPADELAARRRRRQVTRLLVAAVAVIAVGFGYGQLSGGLGSGADDAASSAGGASRQTTEPEATSAGGDAPADSAGSLGRLAIVSRKQLVQDALSTRAQENSYDTSQSVTKACLKPGAGEQAVAVIYQGKLATLVYRQPADGLQKVDLYRCDPRGFEKSVRIPAP